MDAIEKYRCRYDDKWCRRRYTILENWHTKKGKIIDNFVNRYRALREKIGEFARIVEIIKQDDPSVRLVMVGLTIAKIEDYHPGMIRAYVKNLKRRLGKKLYAFAWVAEMQERGAVHYHLQACIDKTARIPKPDKSGMWPWGSSRIVKAESPYYLCTYIGKERQKDLSRYPKSCRTYSVSYRLPEGRAREYYESLRKIAAEEKKKKRIVGNGGWYYRTSTVSLGLAELLVKKDIQ